MMALPVECLAAVDWPTTLSTERRRSSTLTAVINRNILGSLGYGGQALVAMMPVDVADITRG